MTTYTWKIESVDEDAGTMIVEFTHGEKVVVLNMQTPPLVPATVPPVDPAAPPVDPTAPLAAPLPPVAVDLGTWIDLFAPRQAWEPKPPSNIEVGATGSAQVVLPAPPQVAASETPQVAGSVNEEYLRAMIYQVLEEIKDAKV